MDVRSCEQCEGGQRDDRGSERAQLARAHPDADVDDDREAHHDGGTAAAELQLATAGGEARDVITARIRRRYFWA